MRNKLLHGDSEWILDYANITKRVYFYFKYTARMRLAITLRVRENYRIRLASPKDQLCEVSIFGRPILFISRDLTPLRFCSDIIFSTKRNIQVSITTFG